MYYQTVFPNASISFNDYIKGNWSFSKKNEEETYEDMSPDFNFIVSEVKIKKYLSPIGDAYSYHRIKYSNEKDTNGINDFFEVKRKDYYTTFKTYCIELR